MKRIGLFIVCMMLIVGVSTAAVLPCATPETQSIETITVVDCNGFVTSSQDYVATVSSDAINKDLIAGEQQSTAGYSKYFAASQGRTTYLQTADFETGAVYPTKDNVYVTTKVTYIGEGGARATMDERLAAYSLNNGKTTEFLCPFVDDAFAPPSCESFLTTTYYDISAGSTSSTAALTTIGEKNDLTATYAIVASGEGLITQTLNIHAMEGREADPTLSGNIQYAETNTAYGVFNFAKNIKYQSGL